MKIEKNMKNMKEAWMMTANALNIIKQCFIENSNNEKAKNAYLDLLHETNLWFDEIKKMPF